MLEARHTLQPMHSRMSSMRPSSILRGRNGSAIDGRAAPMKSTTPRLTMAAIVSGLVNRPTPTTGLEVSVLTKAMEGSCQPSLRNREVSMSFGPPTFTSHRSGTSARLSTTARHSSSPRWTGPSFSSTPKRRATAQRPCASSMTSSRVSRNRRRRFSKHPPYSSVRRLIRGDRKSVKTVMP